MLTTLLAESGYEVEKVGAMSREYPDALETYFCPYCGKRFNLAHYYNEETGEFTFKGCKCERRKEVPVRPKPNTFSSQRPKR